MYINKIAYSLGDQKCDLKNADASSVSLPLVNIKIFNKFFGYRYYYSSDETALALLRKSVFKIFHFNESLFENTSYVIHCHTAKMLEPFQDNLLYKIQKEFGLENAITFGTTSENCCSVASSIQLLFDLLQKNESALLLVTDLTFYKTLKVINKYAICSTGSSAIAISHNGENNEVISLSIRKNSKYYNGQNLSKSLEISAGNDYEILVVETILDAIEKAKLTIAHIKLIIPQNVNAFLWKKIAKLLCISYEKIYTRGIYDYAHVFGSDNFINLCSVIEKKLIIKDDFYLMVSAGLGFVASAILVRH